MITETQAGRVLAGDRWALAGAPISWWPQVYSIEIQGGVAVIGLISPNGGKRTGLRVPVTRRVRVGRGAYGGRS